MLKYLTLAIVLFTVIQSINSQRSAGWSGRSENVESKGSGYRGNERNNRYPGKDSPIGEKDELPRKQTRLTAWGIIAIILCSVGVGLGIYYFIFCYPVLCKKQRKYNVMQMTDV